MCNIVPIMSKKVKVKVFIEQSCLILCNPKGCGSAGSSVHGILHARILEWVAILFSGDLPYPRIKPRSLALQVDALLSETLRDMVHSKV